MTGTCSLCGQVIIAEPDGILDADRDNRTLGRFGQTMRAHLEQRHRNAPQTVLDPSIVGPTIASLVLTVGPTAQALTLFSYIISKDELYRGKIAAMADVLARAIAQKELVAIAPGVIVA